MRATLAIMLWAAVALFGYVTLTVPAFEATAPAILTVALAVAAYLVGPWRLNG